MLFLPTCNLTFQDRQLIEEMLILLCPLREILSKFDYLVLQHIGYLLNMTNRPRFLSKNLEFISSQASTDAALSKNDFGTNREEFAPFNTATPGLLDNNSRLLFAHRSIIPTD